MKIWTQFSFGTYGTVANDAEMLKLANAPVIRRITGSYADFQLSSHSR